MTVNNHHNNSFTATAFFTSFQTSCTNSKTIISSSLLGFHTFLQPIPLYPLYQQQQKSNNALSPTLSSSMNKNHILINKYKKTAAPAAAIKQKKQQQQQAMDILPKSSSSPSDIPIYLQPRKFQSLSIFLRNGGHSCPLVENWLLSKKDPLQQLRSFVTSNKVISKNQRSPVEIPPSLHELQLVHRPSQQPINHQPLAPTTAVKNNISILLFHLQSYITETMETQYHHVPCMFTVYHCTGSVSLPIHQVKEISDFYSDYNNNKMDGSSLNSVVVVMETNAATTLRQQVHYSSSYQQQQQQQRQICHYAENGSCVIVSPQAPSNNTIVTTTVPSLKAANKLEYLNFNETIMYEQEDDEEDSVAETRGKMALLKLAQDTLAYIQQGHTVSDQLSNLESRLYTYCNTA